MNLYIDYLYKKINIKIYTILNSEEVSNSYFNSFYFIYEDGKLQHLSKDEVIALTQI